MLRKSFHLKLFIVMHITHYNKKIKKQKIILLNIVFLIPLKILLIKHTFIYILE